VRRMVKGRTSRLVFWEKSTWMGGLRWLSCCWCLSGAEASDGFREIACVIDDDDADDDDEEEEDEPTLSVLLYGVCVKPRDGRICSHACQQGHSEAAQLDSAYFVEVPA
jgi:hypothetical protein